MAIGTTRLADRTLPHDDHAEMAVLGSVILDPKVMGDVATILKDEEFFDERNQLIFRVMRELFESNKPIDGLILRSTLISKGLLDQVGGESRIVELAGYVPSAANAFHYAVIIHEKWQLRRLIRTATKTLRDAYESTDTVDVVIGRAAASFLESSDIQISDAERPEPIIRRIEEAAEKAAGHHITGLRTGFSKLDDALMGLHPQEMIVIAARPSVGKSAIMNNVAEYISIDQKIPSAIFSLEMSKDQLITRLISSRSGIDGRRIACGNIWSNEKDRYAKAKAEIIAAPLHIDDTAALTPVQLYAKARRLHRLFGIKLVAVDYLQLMNGSGAGRNETAEVTVCSHAIKALAKDLGIPVIALSQLNRVSDAEHRRPALRDLRSSGAIEQDADVVMFLHREYMQHRSDPNWDAQNSEHRDDAELIVAKQRNGPCDLIPMRFLASTTRFVQRDDMTAPAYATGYPGEPDEQGDIP